MLKCQQSSDQKHSVAPLLRKKETQVKEGLEVFLSKVKRRKKLPLLLDRT
jgi:predicted O-linked N-acetylglucosamine transferase (SPINDLY family)